MISQSRYPHEYGAKVAEAEYKEFLEMLKSVKKNDSADEAIQKENDELNTNTFYSIY